jgi:hypothetical protein
VSKPKFKYHTLGNAALAVATNHAMIFKYDTDLAAVDADISADLKSRGATEMPATQLLVARAAVLAQRALLQAGLKIAEHDMEHHARQQAER